MTTAQAEPPKEKDRFRSDFAVVCAGFIAGHGILRFFAGFLVAVNDRPRAELLERWFPLWNSLAFFIVAWGVHRLILQFRWPRSRALLESSLPPSPTSPTPAREVPTANESAANDDWKSRMKGAQKRKDVDAILDIRQSLTSVLPAKRVAALDRHLGKWFTRHFQRMLMSGRATDALPSVERVADHYAGSEEFAYFQEILPVVRQCATIKASVYEEDDDAERP